MYNENTSIFIDKTNTMTKMHQYDYDDEKKSNILAARTKVIQPIKNTKNAIKLTTRLTISYKALTMMPFQQLWRSL